MQALVFILTNRRSRVCCLLFTKSVERIDIGEKPYEGTFEVTEGAVVLGCESGSSVDTLTASGDFSQLTCESGERSGTFTIEFDAPNRWMEKVEGLWTIKDGTDDFS